MAGGCATFCVIMSAVGAPLMAYFGYICSQKSPMITLPEAQKPEAGQGCYMAAALYVVTFIIAYFQMKAAQKSASAREVSAEAEALKPVVGEQGRYVRLSPSDH